VGVTAAASSVPPGDDRARTWAEASPAEVRGALAPESADEFDRQWRAALARAAETYDLAVVHGCLEAWRRVARITEAAGGVDGYRALLQTASEAREGRGTGAPRAAWREVRADLGL
jgi:hypothetical protein